MFEVSKSVENAILDTWDYLAPDAAELCEGSDEIAMEFVIDADRLSMQGFTEANNTVKALARKHGFGTVRRELARRIPLL